MDDREMTRRIKMFTNKSNTSILLLALLVSVTGNAPLLSAHAAADNDFEQAHAGHQQDAPARLVELVRDATRQFVDVNASTAPTTSQRLVASAARTMMRWVCITSACRW